MHTCIFYEYNWYAGNTFSNLTIFYSFSLAISNDLLSLALLKTSHFILYQLIVWLFGMVCQISLSAEIYNHVFLLSGIVNIKPIQRRANLSIVRSYIMYQ